MEWEGLRHAATTQQAGRLLSAGYAHFLEQGAAAVTSIDRPAEV